MNKQYSNVKEFIKSISNDKKFNNSLEKEINSKQLSRFLVSMRNRKNLSEDQLAEKLNVSKRKIEKIENSYDNELKMNDILEYARGVEMQIEVSFFDEKTKLVDRVKYHYFRMKKSLDEIVDMSQGDQVMEKEAEKFSVEAFFNVITGIANCVKRASKKEIKKESPLLVSSPVNYARHEVARPN